MTATLYLRFPDAATFLATLDPAFEQQGETGAPLPGGVTAISIIGPRASGGTYDEQGNVLTPPVIDSRWHVNAEGALPAAWAQYQIFPATPDRVFGG